MGEEMKKAEDTEAVEFTLEDAAKHIVNGLNWGGSTEPAGFEAIVMALVGGSPRQKTCVGDRLEDLVDVLRSLDEKFGRLLGDKGDEE